jgi:hypothetical protein
VGGGGVGGWVVRRFFFSPFCKFNAGFPGMDHSLFSHVREKQV